ncbi:MAG TPA: GAP family protein [Ktedonobacteraceae bacterium]|nr:GAP family protein [Ktedonobacteraceae bacterium]
MQELKRVGVMVSVILKMLPFALGTITPTMIGLIVLFLTSTQGLVKSISFILGKYIVYVLWGLLCLNIAGFISSSSSVGTGTVSVVFFLIFGLLLLILAIRTFFGEDDPDTPPPKFMSILDNIGPFKLFGLGIAICFMQPRFIILILAGASIITDATLPASENFIAILVLALLMVWVMFIPITVFLVMGKRRDAAMKSMRGWLVSNQRMINVVVMFFFGVLMIILGLSRIF